MLIGLQKTVCISGLKSSPSLNGKTGEVRTLNVAPGRHAVLVDGKTVSIKAENLKVRWDGDMDPELLLATVHRKIGETYAGEVNVSMVEIYYEKALAYFSKAEKSIDSVEFI